MQRPCDRSRAGVFKGPVWLELAIEVEIVVAGMRSERYGRPSG